jgi:hypothetical protein
MSHPLRFGSSYSTEMLRNKVRLKREPIKDSCHDDARRREAPGLGNAGKDAFALKTTRTS